MIHMTISDSTGTFSPTTGSHTSERHESSQREGRIVPETQDIQCSYHGWTYNSHNNGICTNIPQLEEEQDVNDITSNDNTNDDEGITSSNRSKNRNERILQHTKCTSSFRSYPCMVEKNILWGWLWSSESSPESTSSPSSSSSESSSESSTTTTTSFNDNALMYEHLPEYYLSNIPVGSTTYTRLVPYSYDILIENIMDISHVPFAHHTLQGTRDDCTTIKPIIQSNIQPLYISSNSCSSDLNTTATTTTSSDDLYKDGFTFHFSDQTRKLQRIGTCTFRAPYVVSYDSEFIVPTIVSESISDPSKKRRRNKNKSSSSSVPKFFNLTTLLIPVSAGWSKIIIFSSFGTANNNSTSSSTTNSEGIDQIDNDVNVTTTAVATTTTTSTTTVKSNEKKPKSNVLLKFIISKLPVWFLHIFSNKFLDSDLILLHEQEKILNDIRRRYYGSIQQQQQIDGKNDIIKGHMMSDDDSKIILNQYYMPSKADRSIVMIRKWISQYASAVYKLSSSTETTTTPTTSPYINRPLLFDRYNQHTKQCKYCNTMLEVTIPKYKKYSYMVLCTSILLLNRHFIFRLLCVSSIISFRIYHMIEQALRYGEFDHSTNH